MSAESIEYQPPVSSTAHQSLRQWIRNRWGCVVVVATVLYNFVLNGLLFNYNLLFVAFQQEFESSATLTGISNDCIYYINRGRGGGPTTHGPGGPYVAPKFYLQRCNPGLLTIYIPDQKQTY